MISDGAIFSIYVAIGLALFIVQVGFYFKFKKKDIAFSDFDVFHNQYGAWWYFKKPGLAFEEKYKWLAVAPSYLAAFWGILILAYQVICH